MARINQCGFAVLLYPAIIASALLSFAFCVAAEFNKLKKNDLRIDGKLCYLPGSAAFHLGIAALICLSISQILATLLFIFRSRHRTCACQVTKPTVPCGLFLLSWVSFGIAVVLISSATSMGRSQPYGEGWLDGECYLVRDGVYLGSALLVLLAMISILSSAGAVTIKERPEESIKVQSMDSTSR